MTPSKTAKLTGSAPVLFVRDVYAATKHYRDAMGFSFGEIFGEPPSFAILKRDNMSFEAPDHFAGLGVPQECDAIVRRDDVIVGPNIAAALRHLGAQHAQAVGAEHGAPHWRGMVP